MNRHVAVAALALALAAPAAAHAQVHLGVSAGVSTPTGNNKDFLKSGYAVNGLIGLTLPMSPIGLRGEIGYNAWDGKADADGGTLSSLSGTANVVLQVPGMIVAKPYVIGGLGWHKLKFDQPDGINDNEMGWNIGGGVNFGVGLLNAMVEARYVSVSTPGTSNDRLTYVPVTFGIMF